MSDPTHTRPEDEVLCRGIRAVAEDCGYSGKPLPPAYALIAERAAERIEALSVLLAEADHALLAAGEPMYLAMPFPEFRRIQSAARERQEARDAE